MSKFRKDILDLVENELSGLRKSSKPEISLELDEMLVTIMTAFSKLYCTIMFSQNKIKRNEVNDISTLLINNLNETVIDFNTALNSKKDDRVWN
jgi:hypothetical protein